MRLTFMAGAVAAASLTGVFVGPSTAAAQPGGVSASCSIDANNPKELAMQSLAFTQAKASQNPEQRKKVLMGIIKELDTKPERFAKNPAGYQFTLSEALKLWALEPGMPATPTRSSLGFVTNPTETIDVVVALDAAYKAIVAAVPACEADMKAQRQNEVWLQQTQAALSASNGGNLDSAEYYAKRSLMLVDNPYPHYVLANVSNARGDKKAAVMHWKHVVQRAGSDTSYRDIVNGSLYYVAMTQLEMASTAQGADQQTLGKEAAAAFKVLLAASPDSPDAANYYNGWADALTLAKDTASIPQVYAGLLAAPDKATDISLTMAGVIATRANKTDDALKLFEAAVAKNPNNRDGLRNLAATYYSKDKFKEMFEPTRKLVGIDPNNYDGWMMFAYASQGLGKSAKLPAEKKAWTDSLVKYQTLAEGMPVKVEVAGFTRGQSNATLSLALEQVTAAGTYTITAEFLDEAGAVVATATESTGALKKGERKTVEFKAAAPKIYGYRYKPVK
jgi:tetratricopeptide (TPR) repeat protein